MTFIWFEPARKFIFLGLPFKTIWLLEAELIKSLSSTSLMRTRGAFPKFEPDIVRTFAERHATASNSFCISGTAVRDPFPGYGTNGFSRKATSKVTGTSNY